VADFPQSTQILQAVIYSIAKIKEQMAEWSLEPFTVCQPAGEGWTKTLMK